MLLKKRAETQTQSQAAGSVERAVAERAANRAFIDVVVITTAGVAVFVVWVHDFPAWIALTVLVAIAALDFWVRYIVSLSKRIG